MSNVFQSVFFNIVNMAEKIDSKNAYYDEGDRKRKQHLYAYGGYYHGSGEI
jgi:hypothetical protein